MIRISPLNDYMREHPDALTGMNPKFCSIPTLVVRHPDHAGVLWTLRLVEFFGEATGSFGYQPQVNWVAESADRWCYTDAEVSANPDHRGICSCSVQAAEDHLAFELSVTNHSKRTWTDTWGWLCLIHRWAQAFQANCELPVGDGDRVWRPVASLDAPMQRWLKWCPIEQRLEVAQRIGRNQGARWQPHIRASQGAVRAWRVEHGGLHQSICLTSPDAVLLGWSHWPCTDMGVCFGTLAPGQTGTTSGKLTFDTTRLKKS